MHQYLELIQRVIDEGVTNEYRNGGRRSVFNHNLEFDLSIGFPLVTVKETNYKAAFDEMLWFLSGSTNINDLAYPNTWKAWALEKNTMINNNDYTSEARKGSIGPIYGHEYRRASNNGIVVKEEYNTKPELAIAPDIAMQRDLTDYDACLKYAQNTVDQLWELVNNLKNNPHSTRHRIAVYSPATAPDEKLTPKENVARGKGSLTACTVFQQYTVCNGKLALHITIASSDVLIGLPYNIAQFALLLSIIAREVNLQPGMLYINIGDAHIYSDQLTALDESNILYLEPRYIPELVIEDSFNIWDSDPSMLHVVGYMPHPFVKLNVST